MSEENQTPASSDASVIAHRKSCSADGVGLSHYILMDKEGKSSDAPSVIAERKSCQADGVGLSHYILMDKQQNKQQKREA